MKFYDREKEIAYLRDVRMKSEKNARFTVITGRRRVGKTALINEFIGKKNAIYFMGVEMSAKQNLENFSKILSRAALSRTSFS